MRITLDEGAFMPEKKHPTDAGFDLRTPIDFTLGHDKCRILIDTGVSVELPPGTVGMIKSRSGLNWNNGIQCEGVIDENYRGTIGVVLYNHGRYDVSFKRGDRIAQLVILPCVYTEIEIVDELKETDRGEGGFGSTGVK